MRWMNTESGYGAVARFFHWLVAVLLLGQLSVGAWMVGLPNSEKASIYGNHKTFGLFILLLVTFRLGWRVVNTLPKLPEGTPKWKTWAARSLHRTFYFLMFAMPITGWMMSTSAGYLPSFPGLGKVAFPFFSEEGFCLSDSCYSKDFIGGLSHDGHAIFSWIIVGLLLVHISVALWHLHLKDGVFARIFVDRT